MRQFWVGLISCLALICAGIPSGSFAQDGQFTPLPPADKGWCYPEFNGQQICGYSSAAAACQAGFSYFYDQGGYTFSTAVSTGDLTASCIETEAGCSNPNGCLFLGRFSSNLKCEGSGPRENGQCVNVETPPALGRTCSAAGQNESGDTNPIDIISGRKYQNFVDYASPDGRFVIARRYVSGQFGGVGENSNSLQFGVNWTLQGFPRLILKNTNNPNTTFDVLMPDGRAIEVKRIGGSYKVQNGAWGGGGEIGLRASVQNEAADGSIYSQDTQIVLTDIDGKKYTYRSQANPAKATPAELMSIDFPGGYRQTFTYSSPGKIKEMSDNLGRVATFRYLSTDWTKTAVTRTDKVADFEIGEGTDFLPLVNLIQEISLPDGTLLKYEYDAKTELYAEWQLGERLRKVSRVTGAEIINTERYLYENNTYPFHLTGQVDAKDIRYGSWAYDEYGRAILSEHPNGVDRTTISYNRVSGTDRNSERLYNNVMTNALGKETIYKVTLNNSAKEFVIDDVIGTPSDNCLGDQRQFKYAPRFVSGVGLLRLKSEAVDKNGNITKYQYDEQGRVTSKVQAFGTPQQTTTLTEWHPEFRLPISRTVDGLKSEYVYDAAGRMLSMTRTDLGPEGPDSRTWTYTYDGPNVASIDGPLAGPDDSQQFIWQDAKLKSVTNALGQTYSFTAHNSRDQPLRMNDPNGVETWLEYDGEGKVISIRVDPNGVDAETRMTYDAVDNITSVTPPNGARLNFVYDDARRLMSITNKVGEQIVYTRNAMGGIIHTRLLGADGSADFSVAQVMDEMNRLLKVAQVGGTGGTSETEMTYDRQGNVVEMRDPRNNVWQTQFDALNRLTKEIDPLGAETDYELEAQTDGRVPLVGVTDARDVVTNFVRNGFGELAREFSFERGTTEYVRDARGLVTSMTDARGVQTLYSYDALGRLISQSYPDAPQDDVAYEYDAGPFGIGQLTAIVESFGRTEYAYNVLGFLISETRIIDGQSYTTSYDYDKAGEIISTTYPSGTHIALTRDDAARITDITYIDPETQAETALLSEASYKAFGPLTGASMGDGHVLAIGYDEAYRAKSLRRIGPNGTLMDIDFAHDDAGDITAMTDNAYPERSQSFAYDPVSRLTQASGGYGNIDYSYNLGGDRLSKTLTDMGDSQTQTYDYDSVTARLTQVSLDSTPIRAFDYAASGQMTRDTQMQEAGAQVYNFDLNARGRIQTVRDDGAEVAAYRYDIYQQRISKSSASGAIHYHYDEQGRLIAETDGGTGETLREYVWFGLTPIATLAPSEDAGPELCNQALIDELAARLIDRRARLATVQERYVSAGDNLADRQAREAELTAIRADVQTRLDAVPETNVIRVDVLTARLENLDTRVTELNAAIDRIGTRAEELQARITQLTEIIARIEARAARLEARCAAAANDNSPPAAATGSAAITYLHADHLGRPAFATDAMGEILWDGGITTPFGLQIETMGAITQSLMFPGQYQDEETGYFYNWNRTYDPTLGRYLQSDPIGLAGGLNRYAYVGGNPVSYVDFEGLFLPPIQPGSAIAEASTIAPRLSKADGVLPWGDIAGVSLIIGASGRELYNKKKYFSQPDDCSDDDGDDDCAALNLEIKSLRDELARRSSELKEDKLGLPETGKFSKQGHRQQIANKQRRLRRLLEEAASKGCTISTPDAWKWATI